MRIPWNKGIKWPEHLKKKLRKPKGIKRFGENAPNWRGGRRKLQDGYFAIYSPTHPNMIKTLRLVREHRLVIEKHLGRMLLKEECVHHINEIKSDNRLENLYLFPSNSAHRRYHTLLKNNPHTRITKSNLA